MTEKKAQLGFASNMFGIHEHIAADILNIYKDLPFIILIYYCR